MSDCPQDKLNRIWRLFAAQGIGDDLQIIEAVAYHLLRRNGAEAEVTGSRYPQPIPLSETREASLQTLLDEALATLTPAKLLNECLLFKPDNMQAGGRYATPRHITRLMAGLTRIFVSDGDTAVADFACGSGGLLVEFGSNPIPGIDGHPVTGVEISPAWARIARANLRLHSVATGEIHTGDALAVVGSRIISQFGIIAMNPPFGSPLEATLVEQRLNEGKGTRSETVLTLLALNYLQSGGVLAVLQPGGALFSTSSGEVTLRERLLTENRLEAVIQLPKDAFQPYSQLQTYLLLARNSQPGSLEANAPVWFFHITHDGFSSGRNRQPQPEQSQLPQLVEAITLNANDPLWQINDAAGEAQLDICPLSEGGCCITQPGSGELAVHALTMLEGVALWLTRQTEKTYHVLHYQKRLWQPEALPTAGCETALTPLALYSVNDSSHPVILEQEDDGWQLTLKSSHPVRASDTMAAESGFLALFVAEDGALLSPLLYLEDAPKAYKPKPLTILPLENEDHAPAGSLLLWDCSAAQSLFFATESGDEGQFLWAGEGEGALIGWENGRIYKAVTGQLKRTFAGEPWQRGVVVDENGERFGVGVAPDRIAAARAYDLTFDRYYLPDAEETAVQRSPAEILAAMRHKQQALAGRLDYLLGVVEMRPTQTLPSPLVDATPPDILNDTQRIVWQRIENMVETVNGVTTAWPFRPEALATGLNTAEVRQTLTLFELLGLVVPVVIDSAPYYRRLTERDVVTT